MALLTKLFSACLVVMAATTVSARTNSSPFCSISTTTLTQMARSHISQGNNAALGVTVQASAQTYTPGQAVTITFNGSYQGMLMYAHAGAAADTVGATTHLGTFSQLPANFAAKTTGCNGITQANGGTVQHTAPNRATTTSFRWTPPAGATGPITISALLSKGSLASPWGVLSVTLQPAQVAAPPPVVGNSGTSTTTTTTSSTPSPTITIDDPVVGGDNDVETRTGGTYIPSIRRIKCRA